jgi:maltose alpha-D-glucosyltransferase/alpha-amylase
MSNRWYKQAVIYSLEVDTYQDSDGDGCGDFQGLISRLDYLSRLGVTCLWLNPIHPSPMRDAGYDVSDFYGVDSRLGSLGDVVELCREAEERGIRILLDLVVNHTSDQHPWFRSARSSPDSPYRDWYVWSDTEPPDRFEGMVFPGEQTETWTWDDEADAWYYHRFFDFQPDLNWSNPAVRREVKKIIAFWLQLGASGFRIDAAPFILERRTAHGWVQNDFAILDEWRQHLQWIRGDAVLLCEANVDADVIPLYTASTRGGQNDRAQMLFAFEINPLLWLALARRRAEPLLTGLKQMTPLADRAQWVTFLRNHDELDLSRLTTEQRDDVYAEFAPDPRSREFDRGIRRRLAPMFRGDEARMRLAYSLQFSLPGTPMIRYGEEIGMADLMSQPGRDSMRTVMQWEPGARAGFSPADPASFAHPLAPRGVGGRTRPNVIDEQRDHTSLLRWFAEMIRTLKECPEVGTGKLTVLDQPLPPAVLAHRFDADEGTLLLLHNLDGEPVTVDLGPQKDVAVETPREVFADDAYAAPTKTLTGLALNAYGYRWIRLRRGWVANQT